MNTFKKWLSAITFVLGLPFFLLGFIVGTIIKFVGGGITLADDFIDWLGWRP